jgi:hypothetical protein
VPGTSWKFGLLENTFVEIDRKHILFYNGHVSPNEWTNLDAVCGMAGNFVVHRMVMKSLPFLKIVFLKI